MGAFLITNLFGLVTSYQVLAEELEYSELLDKAAETDDPYKRMVYVASFAVSSYASTYYRAGTKPFNPLLGETYECVREDKGFRFMAEQVGLFDGYEIHSIPLYIRAQLHNSA